MLMDMDMITKKTPRRCAYGCAIVLVAAVAAGCAPRRPVLYPNAHYAQVGAVDAERDIAECRQLADQHVSSSGHARGVARDTAVASGVGAAAGAAGGAVWGGAGRGAAAGAAGGAAAGLLHGIFTGTGSTDIYRNFVAACLSERGYHVLGWE
jgi:hypothetical protein